MLDPEVRKQCWTPQSSKEDEEEEGEKRGKKEDYEGFRFSRGTLGRPVWQDPPEPTGAEA